MRLDGSEKRRLMTLSVQPGLSVAFPGLGIGWKEVWFMGALDK